MRRPAFSSASSFSPGNTEDARQKGMKGLISFYPFDVHSPGSIMPKVLLQDKELKELSDYMLSLK
jgi:hypothetical protein